MQLIGRTVLALILIATVACAAGSGLPRQSTTPDFVEVSPPATAAEWTCANWSNDEWHVALDSSSSLLIRPTGIEDGRPVTLAVPGGELIGYNNGEFGGTLVFRDSSMGLETELLEDNPVALFRTPDGAVMIAGLGHMGSRHGHLVALTRDVSGVWHSAELVDLGTSPDAAVQIAPDTLLVATADGLMAVSLGSASSRELYRNEQWYLLYANSVVRSRTGVVYIGMRRGVGVLTPRADGLHETWLVPSTCPVLVPAETYDCACATQ